MEFRAFYSLLIHFLQISFFLSFSVRTFCRLIWMWWDATYWRCVYNWCVLSQYKYLKHPYPSLECLSLCSLHHKIRWAVQDLWVSRMKIKKCIRHSVHWHRQYNKFYLLYLSTVSHGPWSTCMCLLAYVCVDEWVSGFRCSSPNICIHAWTLTIEHKRILFNFSFVLFSFWVISKKICTCFFPDFSGLRFGCCDVVPVSCLLPLVFFMHHFWLFRCFLVYSVFSAVGTNLL